MSVINKCNAPASFINAVEYEIPNVLGFLASMGIDVPQSYDPNIIVADEGANVSSPYLIDLRSLSNTIELIISKMRKETDIPYPIIDYWNWLLPLLDQLMHGLWNKNLSENEGDKLEEIIREIFKIINEIKKQCKKEGIPIPEIVSQIEDVLDKIIGREYPITLLGCFDKPDIYLYYETIKESAANNGIMQNEDLGRSVLAHEIFHAIHYASTLNQKKWNGSTRRSHIRRRAVVEALAEYFSLSYTKTFLTHEVVAFVEQTIDCHPFPNWGYAGARIFDNYSKLKSKSWAVKTIQSEALFKNVFYLSLFNMEEAYRFLKEMKGRLDENKKYGKPLY